MSQTLLTLDRPDGTLTYTDDGEGPLVVCIPGMGDLRSSYGPLAPRLTGAGFRAAVTDLRGQGDASTSFHAYGDEETAGDVVALLEALDAGPAVVVGSSMGGSAATIAAAERPDLVSAVVLLSGFLRENASPMTTAALHGFCRVAFARPWGAAFWAWYVRTQLAKGRPTPGLDDRVAEIRTSYADPQRLRAFRMLTLSLDHRVVEPRLPDVHAPVLAIYGNRDPDFSDVQREASFATDAVGAETVVLDEVGHHPHLQATDDVAEAILGFLGRLVPAADRA